MAQLVRRWTFGRGPVAALELHLTPDIVGLPPEHVSVSAAAAAAAGSRAAGAGAVDTPVATGCAARNFALLTSSNPLLQPPQFTTSQAAAAFPGTNIIYPEQVVDGRLHEFGGAPLQSAMQAAHPPVDADGTRCRVGAAVMTVVTADCELSQNFARVVHTVAPAHGLAGWREHLGSCYRASLDLVWHAAATECESQHEQGLMTVVPRQGPPPHPPAAGGQREVVAVAAAPAYHGGSSYCGVVLPLLGAGAKGVPVPLAARIAAEHCVNGLPRARGGGNADGNGVRRRPNGDGSHRPRLELRFGVQDDRVAAEVEDEFEAAVCRHHRG
jgi:O-acetyl-ADP-ribose deacetylase (regulator of RNase III)